MSPTWLHFRQWIWHFSMLCQSNLWFQYALIGHLGVLALGGGVLQQPKLWLRMKYYELVLVTYKCYKFLHVLLVFENMCSIIFLHFVQELKHFWISFKDDTEWNTICKISTGIDSIVSLCDWFFKFSLNCFTSFKCFWKTDAISVLC